MKPVKGLGRRPQFDERSRVYSIRTLLVGVPLASKTWPCSTWLDQGQEGACVGFSWAHDIAAEPVVALVVNADGQHIYNEARKIDEWEGEDYDGTSVLAGAKVMMALGWVDEYRWAFSLEDALSSISSIGPVVLGINWYEGMGNTDAWGFIRPTGSIVGGHAILALGYDHENQAVLLHNSWGQTWGEDGRAWIKVSDLGRLLNEDGEACVPLVRSQFGPEPEPVPIEPEPTPEPEPVPVEPDPEPTPIEPEPIPVEPEPEPIPEPEPEPVPGWLTRFFAWIWGWFN